MLKHLRTAFAGLILTASPALALDSAARSYYLESGDIQTYLEARFGLGLDEKCFFLKRFEREIIAGASQQAWTSTRIHADNASGKLSQDDYASLLGELEDRARDYVELADCNTSSAFFIDMRGFAAREAFVAALIALEGDRGGKQPLRPDQRTAIQNYGGLLEQFYGADFPAFLDWAKGEATIRLNNAGYEIKTVPDDIFDENGDLDFSFGSPELRAIWNNTLTRVNAITREVAVESGGMRLRASRGQPSGWLDALTDAQGTPLAYIWQATEVYVPASATNSLSLWTVAPDGKSGKLMLYGATAESATHAAFFIAPDAERGLDEFDRDGWRDKAIRFDAVAGAAACIPGPCFDLPPALVSLLVNGPENVWIEVALLPGSDAPLPDRDSGETNAILTSALPRWYATLNP